MSIIRSVCVFCGSRPGDEPIYVEEARRLGALFALAGVTLVYGGGGMGLMGAVADGALDAGGHVIGVIPDFLLKAEAGHGGVSEPVVVATMHERKMIMFERADAFVVLPGGIGTLEELFEIMSWRTLALHDKPMVMLNTAGYWTPLLDLIERVIGRRFASANVRDSIRFVDSATDVLPALRAMPRGSLMKPLDRT
ncbi:MAG: TIGR00730 family Rossman fold protein [Alphaproteobacteria bacterium]|nr:TIGR00730 family Rossman fold protein [Alphaproteobacteria bacterium]